MSRHSLHHLPGILPFAHNLLRHALQPGDRAVDATAGNGHDTLMLAQCVGEAGHVHAFDVQPHALAATKARLQQAGLHERVTLIADSHANLGQYISHPLQAAVFNLGYLPGSDKTVVTQPQSTVQALTQALDALQPGGVLVIVLYGAHPGAQAECAAVEHWAQSLNVRYAQAVRYQLVNQQGQPPYVLALEKR